MGEGVARIAPAHLRRLLQLTDRALTEHRDEIDALNVYPVPDGDTGTNLLLTVRSALEAADGVDDTEVAAAISRGAVMGARGNSGVIFSQVLRGLAETASDRELDVPGMVTALQLAQRLAYEAVARPVEGTLLTAVRVAAETAASVAERVGSLRDLSEQVRMALHVAVERTTEQLEALRAAGVVDAGARGFEVFWQVVHGVVTGEAVVDELRYPPPHVDRDAPVAERESGSLEFRFEVQYLLTADEEDAAALRRRLGAIGDSVVVVSGGDVLNVHVHTNDVGAAIEEGLLLGRPSRIQVTYFADQIAERAALARRGEVAAPDPTGLGVVVVLNGDGLRALAEEHGAAVVDGMAGDLPSVADLLNAIGTVSADEVVILPGHRNAVPTAYQATLVSEAEGGRPIHVVEAATSAIRVLAALAVYDPSAPLGSTLASMRDAADGCGDGEVVAAVRDADTPAGAVREGQWLSVVHGDVVAVCDDPTEAVERLAEACEVGRGEVVTLVVGAGVERAERERVTRLLIRMVEDGEVEVIDGGQRPARYVLGVE